MTHKYVVGQLYKDTNYRDRTTDQFGVWLSDGLDNGLSSGGGIRAIQPDEQNDQLDLPAAIVLVTSNTETGEVDKPWRDAIDFETGSALYWGDARSDSSALYRETQGNTLLQSAYEIGVISGHREQFPPILLFQRPEKGVVRFCGLCTIDDIHTKEFIHNGVSTPNLLYQLSILETPEVSVEWIHERARRGTNSFAPFEWKDWVENAAVQSRYRAGSDHFDTTSALPEEYAIEPYTSIQTTYPIPKSVRDTALKQYNQNCLLTGVDVLPLVDVAHILPRATHPEQGKNPDNLLVLNKLHHTAFDRGLFTIDGDKRLQVKPEFSTQNQFLDETLIQQDGEPVNFPTSATVDPGFFEARNTELQNDQLSWL